MKYYIGIDIGGMSIKAGVTTKEGKILATDTFVTEQNGDPAVMVKNMFELCEKITAKAGLSKDDIAGIGIGSPGTINSAEGVVVYANNIKMDNVPLVPMLKKYWDTEIKIDNDANCAALGEATFGCGKEVSSSLFVTLGTGVGTGLILDGKIWSGNSGAGGEGGHIALVHGGEHCTCGEDGCWEAYASATALIRDTKRAMEKHPDSLMHKVAAEMGKVNGRTCFEAAKLGDKAGREVMEKYVEYVGAGIVSIITFIRPDMVMVGGGISNEGDYFIDMVQAYCDAHNYGAGHNPPIPVRRALLKNDAGILGAAALVM